MATKRVATKMASLAAPTYRAIHVGPTETAASVAHQEFPNQFSVIHGWSAFGGADHGWQDIGLEGGLELFLEPFLAQLRHKARRQMC
jgi:hypothetical protein